jgi:hypothetical protein
MRAIVVIILLVAVAALLGWVTFSRENGRPSATVQTDVVRRDVHKAAEATQRAADKAAAKGERLIDKARRTDIDVNVRHEPATDRTAAGNGP